MTNYNTIYRNDKRLILDDNGLDYLVSLEQKINKAASLLEKGITFCKNDSGGVYDTCNIVLKREQEALNILRRCDMGQKPVKIGHIRLKTGQLFLKLGQVCVNMGQKFLKTGQYYITLNNPRELLLQNKELQDKIYELEHPEEQLLKAEGLLKDFYDLVCERDTYKAKLNMVKDLVMNSDKYDDGDFEGCVFQNDILDIIRGDINDK